MDSIKTVGIIGAGQMGSGIAQVCALAGLDVLMHERTPRGLKKGIDRWLRSQPSGCIRKISEERRVRLCPPESGAIDFRSGKM